MKMFQLRFSFCSRVTVSLVAALCLSCSDFIDVGGPRTTLTSETVFENDLTATSAMAGIYNQMGGSGFAGGNVTSVTFLGSLLADEGYFRSTSANYVQLSNNAVLPTNSVVLSIWSDMYAKIYACNALLEGIAKSDNLSDDVRKRLEGESKFVRAFAYFYLVNLFGDVPYTETTDYRNNGLMFRQSTDDVYARIISDLTEAKGLLGTVYSGDERVTPTKWAAVALLARVHLYRGDWANAESEATQLIDNTDDFELVAVDEVFKKNSREAVWQLIPSNNNNSSYTNEGNVFIQSGSPRNSILRDSYVAAAYDDDDLRKSKWIGVLNVAAGKFQFGYKYRENFRNGTGAEYSMVLRLAELYLIRGEARVRQGKLLGVDGAEGDINVVRMRAGLDNTTATTEEELLNAVIAERKAEFLCEWGHRWFDMKRLQDFDFIETIKPEWSGTDVLLPVPQSEILVNKNLEPQNPGY